MCARRRILWLRLRRRRGLLRFWLLMLLLRGWKWVLRRGRRRKLLRPLLQLGSEERFLLRGQGLLLERNARGSLHVRVGLVHGDAIRGSR